MWITSKQRWDITNSKSQNWFQERQNGQCYISTNVGTYGRNFGNEVPEKSDVIHWGKQPWGKDSTCKHCLNASSPELSEFKHYCYLLSAASHQSGVHHSAYLSTMYFTPQQLDSANQICPMQSVVYMMSSCYWAATKVWNDHKDMSNDEKTFGWLFLGRN